MNNSAKEQAGRLPSGAGVYKFLNSEGVIIYVGKAKNLKKRVASYFLDSKLQSSKVRVMARQIENIEYIEVDSEYDALLLENNLIKALQPRYNILLKDDKTYPWIVVRNEPFPRVESTRRLIKDGSTYFGPYASISMQRSMLDVIRSVYTLRTCKLALNDKNIKAGKYNVCLEYHLGNCKAPCIGAQSAEDYAESIGYVKGLLKGESAKSRTFLKEKMMEAAEKLQFEQAHKYKLRLEALENYVSRSVIIASSDQSMDVFSLLIDSGIAYCNFTRIVKGAIVNSFTSELSVGVETSQSVLLTQAIGRISERLSGRLSSEVLVEYLPETELFADVKFTIPKRGDKLKLLEFSQKGARLYRAEKLKNLEIIDPERHTTRVLEAMQKALYLDVPPRHIECFDNSNLQGSYPVASCVVFRDCKPSKKEYRHFNIKTVVGANDFASMREIILRRYSRMLSEGSDLPDLIIVDGGKGQLSFAYSALKELGIEGKVRIVGLAKRIEEVFFPNDSEPYYLERTGEPLRFIMHLRDEAHRFGITFHRQKRSKDFIKSELETVEGIGKLTAEKLLKKFKTIKAISKLTKEQLTEIVGEKRSDAILKHFKNEN